MKRDFHIITVCITITTPNWSGFYISISYFGISKNIFSSRNWKKAILMCLLSLHLLRLINKCVLRENERRGKVFNMRLRCHYLQVFLLSGPVKKFFVLLLWAEARCRYSGCFSAHPVIEVLWQMFQEGGGKGRFAHWITRSTWVSLLQKVNDFMMCHNHLSSLWERTLQWLYCGSLFSTYKPGLIKRTAVKSTI